MSGRAFAHRGQLGTESSGSAGARAGKQLERAIKSVNEWYDLHRVAAIEKVNPPIVGWGESMVMLRSTVDYTGTWLRPESGPLKVGVPFFEHRTGIAFDAKSLTGKAQFGLESIPQGKKNAARERIRFMAQVEYLRGLRDRHQYVAFFLLYCAELETLWLCDDLDTLARGESIHVRTKSRADGGAVEHHLRHITARLELAAVPRFDTRRPHLDYLSLPTP